MHICMWGQTFLCRIILKPTLSAFRLTLLSTVKNNYLKIFKSKKSYSDSQSFHVRSSKLLGYMIRTEVWPEEKNLRNKAFIVCRFHSHINVVWINAFLILCFSLYLGLGLASLFRCLFIYSFRIWKTFI